MAMAAKEPAAILAAPLDLVVDSDSESLFDSESDSELEFGETVFEEVFEEVGVVVDDVGTEEIGPVGVLGLVELDVSELVLLLPLGVLEATDEVLLDGELLEELDGELLGELLGELDGELLGEEELVMAIPLPMSCAETATMAMAARARDLTNIILKE
ncbi:hypothetical protein GGI21_002577 [Coemansia aciculifera]|nr:hypothetical protein GGI21_002577 [Coemansia aciculifera]